MSSEAAAKAAKAHKKPFIVEAEDLRSLTATGTHIDIAEETRRDEKRGLYGEHQDIAN